MNRLPWMSIPLTPYTSLLAKYLHPLRIQVFGLALLIFTGTALQLLNPLVIRIALIHQRAAVAHAYIAKKVAWQAANALRIDLSRHCLQYGISFLHAGAPGELIKRIAGEELPYA